MGIVKSKHGKGTYLTALMGTVAALYEVSG